MDGEDRRVVPLLLQKNCNLHSELYTWAVVVDELIEYRAEALKDFAHMLLAVQWAL